MTKLQLHQSPNLEAYQVRALNSTQLKILTTMIEGNSNKKIAAILHIAPQSVHNQLSIIYKILKVRNRTAAAVKAFHLGIVH